MKILAFDTSTAQGAVAVLDGERVLIERTWRREKSHSELLTAEIESTLKEAATEMSSVDAFAVGQGPGSFTGIRVAINAARALAYALQKPVYVFKTSEILIQPVTRTDLAALTIINAQKNSFYVARFENIASTWTCTREVAFVTLQDLELILSAPHLCLGDGVDEAVKYLSDSTKLNIVRYSGLSDFPLASALGHLVASGAAKGQPFVWNAVQPLYIRASGAEEKLGKGH